jgi:hypothetical protein
MSCNICNSEAPNLGGMGVARTALIVLSNLGATSSNCSQLPLAAN